MFTLEVEKQQWGKYSVYEIDHHHIKTTRLTFLPFSLFLLSLPVQH